MLKVPDALSFAAIRYLVGRFGRRVGGSTGTSFVGVLYLAGLQWAGAGIPAGG